MTDEEIVRYVRTIRHSSRHERNCRRLPSINGLAVFAGITRTRLYEIADTGQISPRHRNTLDRVIQCWHNLYENGTGLDDQVSPSCDCGFRPITGAPHGRNIP